MKFLLGKKIEMSQIFDEKGNVFPVTFIQAGPCYVVQLKDEKPRKAPSEQRGKKDGYEAVQIGFERLKPEKVKKSQKGKPFRHLKEFRTDISKYKIGDEINVSVFEPGDKVKISGVSKGKGFAGGVKRWGFKDRAKAHGAKDMRKIGSVGSRFPQRVIKGKKMPGRMGTKRITIKNLEIIKIDSKNNLIAVKGAMPGSRGTLLEIKGE